MRQIVGQRYPEDIGGSVATPSLVLGCGDCTDWPTRQAVKSYERTIAQLPWPTYQIMGNHDEGDTAASRIIDTLALVVTLGVAFTVLLLCFFLLGLARRLRHRRGLRLLLALVLTGIAACVSLYSTASDPHRMRNWIVARHGDVSYSFDANEAHFVMLFSKYNPRHQITDDALTFLRNDLKSVPAGKPVIVASHYCFEAISNRDAYVDAMGDANVVLVLGGHYHQSTVNEYRGKRFVQVGSPRTGSMFTVVRVRGNQVSNIAWDFHRRQWKPITSPAPPCSPRPSALLIAGCSPPCSR